MDWYQATKQQLKDDPDLIHTRLRDKGGITLLHMATMAGHPQVVELLLDHGANVDIRDDDGATPLHYAAAGDDLELVTLLLDRGANAEARSDNGLTPPVAALAAQEGQEGAVYWLLVREKIMRDAGLRLPPGRGFRDLLLHSEVREKRSRGEALTQADIDHALADAFALAKTGQGRPHTEVVNQQPEPGFSQTPGFRIEYRKVYVDFGEGGIQRHSLQDYNSWTGYQTPESRQFYSDLEDAVMELLAPHFAERWTLDGTFGTCVTWNSDIKNVLLSLGGTKTIYKGCWVRLRRLVP